MTEYLSAPVLIVGGGPTGLLASILLSRCRISHVLIEQRGSTVNAPAAHVVNTRTMEIYRQAGLDVAELYALNAHPTARHVMWKSRLQHGPIGVFDMASNRNALMAQSRYSGEHTTNISQHLLEAYLRRNAEDSEYADIRFGVEWQAFVSADKRTSRLCGPAGQMLKASYQYLIAADGAGSPVARALGIRKVGPDAIATFLNLTCEVDVAHAAGEDSALLYWLLDPQVQGTIIVHDPQGLAVYMRPLALPHEAPEDFDDARCEALLQQVFDSQPFKIRHKGTWKMTAQVADKFRDGPVFLAGDAIHRFPPTGGLGLNTGVGDVHNLVWKLAIALTGEEPPEQAEVLLDSYELERRPVAQRNCDVSKRNNDKMIEVIRALGLDPAKAGLLARVMGSSIVSHLPMPMKQGIQQFLTRPVRQLLHKAEAEDAEGEGIRNRVAAALANQREHVSSLGLDLGYVYRDGCAVTDQAEQTPGSNVSDYVETTGAGARLPDRVLSAGSSAERLHDLLDYSTFTLLSGAPSHDISLDTFGLPVKSVSLEQETLEGHALHESLALGPDNWVLVRPDGHVMATG